MPPVSFEGILGERELYERVARATRSVADRDLALRAALLLALGAALVTLGVLLLALGVLLIGLALSAKIVDLGE